MRARRAFVVVFKIVLIFLLFVVSGGGQVIHAQMPTAKIKVWNITPTIGFNPDESVEDIAGITRHVATLANPQTIAATIENTTHPEGPCGLIFWNPATNTFKWYGIGGGFSAGIDLNTSAPAFTGPAGSVFGTPTFQPGDVWVAINGSPQLYVNFKGSNNFRFYTLSGANGVQVDPATGRVYFTNPSGTIGRLDPRTNSVTTWAVGGSPHYLAIDGAGRVYSAVAKAGVAGGVDAIVRIDPAAGTSNITSWPIPGGGFSFGLSFQTPDGVAFDSTGNLWFTESASNQIGRLNPATGEICEFTKSGLLNPQLIASTGSGRLLQTFFTEGAGNAVSVITQADAIPVASPCITVNPSDTTIVPTPSVAVFSDSVRTPRTATITPLVVDVPGLNGTPGILRFPMPTPTGGRPTAPNFPSGMTGVVLPTTIFGSYLDPSFAGNSAVFQVSSPAIVAPPPLARITGLSAIAGDSSVYLRWNPLSVHVDGFQVDIEKDLLQGSILQLLLGVSSFTKIGTVFCQPRNLLSIGSALDQDPFCLIERLPDDTPIGNGLGFRFGVRALISGVALGEPPCPDNHDACIEAVPNGFKGPNPPPRPTHRLLFLHGFSGDGRLKGNDTTACSRAGVSLNTALFCDASTFQDTLNFMKTTLGWNYGGELFHINDSFDTQLSEQGTCQPSKPISKTNPCVNDGIVEGKHDFFSASFGSNTADYTDRTGLQHQGNEVSTFVDKLGRGLGFLLPPFPRLFTLVAHSNGGLAARDSITRSAQASRIFQLVTYGTPHRGADPSGLALLALQLRFGKLTDGELDARFVKPCDPLGGVSYPSRLLPDGTSFSFLTTLNQRPLPAGIRYTSIAGVSTKNSPLLDDGNRKADCHSATWDGLVPESSADLRNIRPAAGFIRTNHRHIGQGNDFPTILCAIDPNCAVFTVMSPVNIAVIAPDGTAMARVFSAIPGASYMNVEDSLGHETATVLIPFPVGGDYTVRVGPKGGASPTDTFTITLTQHGTTTTIAQDTKVQDIPPGGFRVAVASVVPFSAFSAKVEILAGPPSKLEVNSVFTLGDASNGIDLLRQRLSLHVGTFTTTIPAGSFVQDKKGRFKFEGVINGVALEVMIVPFGNNSFEFKADGQGVNLSGIVNPITVGLTIGYDGGSTSVAAEFK